MVPLTPGEGASWPAEHRKRLLPVTELHVRWLVFSTGEKFRVSLWPPVVETGVPPPAGPRDARDEQPRLLVFEGEDWQGSIPVRKHQLTDFSREELLLLYRLARQKSEDV